VVAGYLSTLGLGLWFNGRLPLFRIIQRKWLRIGSYFLVNTLTFGGIDMYFSGVEKDIERAYQNNKQKLLEYQITGDIRRVL
jgi:hypothetical protein